MPSTEDINRLLKEEQHVRNGLKVIELAERTQPSSITAFYAEEKRRLQQRLDQIEVEIYLEHHGEDLYTGQEPFERR
ncbi:hypothetical protein EVC20_008 [Rhizobium phage RHph_Y2_17_1]|nr:hypothetical protein EVC19_008 [Rhizobium phage RHph_Y2_11]QIG75747.1 hypothetical protein EVC20_008 [Rhizobium phage RHph_Y2_17_1]